MYYVYDYDIHQGPGSEASDAATLATEAGAFRASLLWFFAFGGGLARNADGGGGWKSQNGCFFIKKSRIQTSNHQ